MRVGHLIGYQRNGDNTADESSTAPITAATSAPSDAAAGISTVRATCGGDQLTADAITARLRIPTGRDTTEVTVRAWDYSTTTAGSAGSKDWASGLTYTLKVTGDNSNGARLTIILDGSEERVYLQVTAIDGSTKGCFFDFYHGEYSQAVG